jgi:hypothetical protein
MKLIRKTTWRDDGEEILGEERATLLGTWYKECFDMGGIDDIPDPENPCHYDSLNTYKTVLQNVWSDQASQGANGLTWELIFTRKCKELVNLVKEGKRRVKRAH